ncbi:MAG: segregation/condensation protein A [Coxiellaceae bacterium]|jgi:segregation and condensation protein A|nr:segregation/condensation protein A [Coxiellaceae bacterium]
MNIKATETTKQPQVYVLGQPLHDLPKDLYIPPNALEIILEAFTGPLDLLLYLIKKENIDILDIPIAQVTAQYMEYVELMKNIHLELAAEYLVMAAMLAEIKSKMLLPKPINPAIDEEDPRAELVRKLREYEQFKKAAEDIEFLPRMRREIFPVAIVFPEVKSVIRPLPKFDIQDLLIAFKDVYMRANMYMHHHINREWLSIRERMTQILSDLNSLQFVSFENMFKVEEGRLGIIITFIAILELLHQNLIEIVQTEIYGSIYLKVITENKS